MRILLGERHLVLVAFLAVPAASLGALAAISGSDVLAAYYWTLWGGFSLQQIPETLLRASPILMASAGLCAAYTARAWNLGAEGQLLLGAMAAAWAGISIPFGGIPGILAAALAGAAAGAAWAGVAGLLRTHRGVNEVLSTAMMNYVATYLASYLLYGPLRNPSIPFPETPPLREDLLLPPLVEGTRLHAGVAFSFLVLAPAAHLVMRHSLVGARLAVLGSGEARARYLGLRVGRMILGSMIVSGLLAGAAGALEVLGVHGRALQNVSQGYGYLAIAVALAAGANCAAAAALSVMLGGFLNGITTAQAMAGVPSGVSDVMTGLLLISAVAAFLRRERPWTW